MSKVIAILGVFAVSIITLFAVMVYLMSTINPPPLDNVDVPDLDVDDGKSGQQLYSGAKFEESHKMGGMFLTDLTTEFILDNMDEIDFLNQRVDGVNIMKNIMGPVFLLHPTMHIVKTPVWPTILDRIEPTPPRRAKPSTGVQSRDDTDNSKPKTRTNPTARSPMKRRSISNVKPLNNTGNNTNEIMINQRNEINKTEKETMRNPSIKADFVKKTESDRNMTDTGNIAAIKYSNGNNNVAKNISNLQTIANIDLSLNTIAPNTMPTQQGYDKKFNNTEFLNMLFDTTIDASNLSISKNHSILINDAVPSNDTEFTETNNDSEVPIY